jgi:hypothetical protein
MATPKFNWERPVAEFVAIFAGVTLSLFADDWRDRRNDARDERAALEAIHRDLVADSAEIRAALVPIAGHERSTLWLLSRWDDAHVPADSVGYALRAYLFYNTYQFQSATFNSLKQADRMGLIRNDSLRAAIVAYYDERQVHIGQFMEALFEERQRILDVVAPHVRWPRPRDPDRAWPMGDEPVRLQSPWRQIAGDNRIYNAIGYQGGLARLALGIGERTQRENRELRDAIRREREAR